ncbi:MAG: glycosyltransferase family 4 protein [Bacteroidales bacterium]
MKSDPALMNSKGKRILIISERFFPEEFIVNELVESLKEKGLVFDVLTQAPSYPYGRVSAYPGYRNKFLDISYWQGIRVYRIKTIQGYRESRVKKILNYIHFAIFCSIVFLFIGRRYHKIFVFHSGPLTVATPALIGKMFFKTVNTIWSVDLWPDTVYMYGVKQTKFSKALLNKLVRVIYKQFDEIYCSSPAFAQRLQHYVGNKPIKTLLQWPQITGGASPDEHTVLNPEFFHFTFTGNIAWTQNLENVMLGFTLASEQNPRIMLNIFGDGSDLERLKGIKAHKNLTNVIFWGRRPLHEMPAIYAQSQVLLISIQSDPVFDLYIPLKFSTYLAFSKPVYAIMNGVVAEMVEDNNLGLSADPSNPEKIGEGFARLALTDGALLSECGENCTRIEQKYFNKEKNIRVLFDVLQS